MDYKDKKQCPKCGEYISNDSRNCKYCGEFLAKGSSNYDYENKNREKKEIIENIKICNNCGEPNKLNAVVCHNCSESLANAEILDKNKDYIKEFSKKENQKERRFMAIRIGYFSLITLTITIFIILIFMRIYQLNLDTEYNKVGQNLFNSEYMSYGEFIRITIFAYIFLIVSAIDNFFPEALFFLHFKNLLMVKNAEPSDYYYFVTKIGSYLVPFGILIFIIIQYYSLL